TSTCPRERLLPFGCGNGQSRNACAEMTRGSVGSASAMQALPLTRMLDGADPEPLQVIVVVVADRLPAAVVVLLQDGDRGVADRAGPGQVEQRRLVQVLQHVAEQQD